MKSRKILIMFLLFSLLFSCMGVPAQASAKVTVLHTYTDSQTPEMYVALKASTVGNVPSDVQFYAADDEELPIIQSNLPIGHIVVIDRSEYYSRHITARHIAKIVGSYLQLLPAEDLVKFIYADMPSQGTHYMTQTEAINNINALTALTSGSSLLPAALNNAFAETANHSSGEPVCKTVAVVANPRLASQASSFTFNSANTKNVAYFTVMVPTRALYEDRRNAGYEDYMAGRSTLSQLATQMGGIYLEIPQKGDVINGNENNATVDTSSISSVSVYLNRMHGYQVDISHLAQLAKHQKGEETFTISMKSQESSLGKFTVTVPIAILPAPTPTPMPENTEPTPTPTATPIPIVINRGDNGIDFRKAIYTLIQNYYLREDYLSKSTSSSEIAFDDEAQVAYDLFCELNSLPMTDGISEAGFFMLTDNDAKQRIVPAPTATPSPVPEAEVTPVPLYPQEDLRIGDSDSNLPNNYIQQLQAQLQALNCFVTEADPQTYKPGLFDQATMDAVRRYCDNYGVTNTVEFGASKELCTDILTVKRSPLVTPTPVPVTPTPIPMIPASGYRIGDTDEAIPGGFIQALQTRLQALNCYATANGQLIPTLGVFDEATMQAINAYCETYSVNNMVPNGVSASLCQDILNAERVPRTTPTISLSDQIKDFLMRPLFAIGTFQVIMWMALVMCAVLVVGIVIVILLMKSGDEGSVPGPSAGPRPQPQPDRNSNRDVYETVHTTPQIQPDDRTIPTDLAGHTVEEGFGKPVYLRIEYLDKVRNESPIISSMYTIGRRDCALLLDPSDMSASGKHAVLYTENGQLYVRDLDSTNGTFVNNSRISKAKNDQFALSDKTRTLDEQDEQDQGYLLNRGDVIRLGRHRITVNW